MQNILNKSQEKNIKSEYFLNSGLIFLCLFLVIAMGTKGIYLALAGIIGLIICPFIYNKSNFFLLFALLVYPFTGFLTLENKFASTGIFYIIAFPSAIWLINKYFNKISRENKYLWAMAIYLTIVLLNLLRPEREIIEFVKDFGQIFYAIFTVLATYHFIKSDSENHAKLNKYLGYLMNTVAFISLGQFITKIGGITIEGYYRVRGIFTNPNEYAFILSVFICFAFFMYLNNDSKKHKAYWLTAIGLNLIALILTFSKTSIINTVVGLSFLGMFLPAKRKFQMLIGFVCTSSVLLTFMSFSNILPSLTARFTDMRSFEFRQMIYRYLTGSIEQGEIFFGHGIDASRNLLEKLMHFGVTNAPHDVFLEKLYNFGLAGIIPFALIFILLIFKGIEIFRQNASSSIKNKIAGAAIISIGFIAIIQNCVSNAFYSRPGSFIFWAMVTTIIYFSEYCKKPDFPIENHREYIHL